MAYWLEFYLKISLYVQLRDGQGQLDSVSIQPGKVTNTPSVRGYSWGGGGGSSGCERVCPRNGAVHNITNLFLKDIESSMSDHVI